MTNLLTTTNTSSPINRQVIARILYIFAKLNPGQGYVQGMNELIGPIYYVFANDKLEWSGGLRFQLFR